MLSKRLRKRCKLCLIIMSLTNDETNIINLNPTNCLYSTSKMNIRFCRYYGESLGDVVEY